MTLDECAAGKRIVVEFENEELTRATLTISPPWFRRLLGHRPRAARVRFVEYGGWRYEIDGDWIGSRLETIVNEQRRWREQVPLPGARVVVEERP